MQDTLFTSLWRAKIATYSKGRIARMKMGIPVKTPRYPKNIENEYARLIRRNIDRLVADFSRVFKGRLAQWVKLFGDEVRAGAMFGDSSLPSDTAAEVDTIMSIAELYAERLYDIPAAPAKKEIGAIAGAVEKKTQKDSDELLVPLVGTSFSTTSEQLKGVVSLWEANNLALQKALTSTMIAGMRSIIINGLIVNKPAREIVKELNSYIESTKEKKASALALGQIGTLFGITTKLRQESIGITTYYWRTRRDNRVRKEHRFMEGVLCRWDDSSVYSSDGGRTWSSRPMGMIGAFPGSQPHCRCSASPNVNNIFNTIIKEL